MFTTEYVVKVSCDCPFCGHVSELFVNAAGYRRWQAGELIQTALPTLNADERECLISGLCTLCQKDFFDEDDEELDEEDFEYSENWNFDWDHLLG